VSGALLPIKKCYNTDLKGHNKNAYSLHITRPTNSNNDDDDDDNNNNNNCKQKFTKIYLETIPGQYSVDSLKNCHTRNITHHKESATS
jgi:hypothetical protein